MASKRMIKVEIVDTDRFLEMPLGAQALYFHLLIRADDDGFVGNPKKIQNSINVSDDDVKILIAKQFIKVFATGVMVVTHWNIHNIVKNDRYKKTVYQNEYKMLELDESKCYILSSGETKQKKQLASKMDTEWSPNIDKINIDKINKKNYYKKSENLDTEWEQSSSSFDKNLEEWILEKAKGKINPSAYAASIKKRFARKEQSIIDEFQYWLNQKKFSSILESAIGKTVQTTEGIKTILGIEPKDGKLDVTFQGGSFTVIQNITTLKKIINQNNNEEIR